MEGEVGIPPLLRVVQAAHIDGGAGLLRHGLHRSHMVVVPVGQEDRPAAETVLLQIVQNGVALVAGVDDGAVQGLLVGDYVAVGLQLPDRDGFDQHIYSSFVSRRMVTGPSLTEATSISAPKTPVSTRKPRARHSAITSS